MVDFDQIFHDTRAFLDLDDDEPVPLDEIKATLRDNGYDEHEVKELIRGEDRITAAGDPFADTPDVQLDDAQDDADDGEEADDADDDPQGETDEDSQDDAVDAADGYLGALDWSDYRSGSFPADVVDRDQWMPVEGKQPKAYYADTENKCSWSNPDNWTSFEHADECVDMIPGATGHAFILQSDDRHYDGASGDPFLFVDYDDVAPEDGDPSDAAQRLMDRLGMTYTDWSSSETGVHQIFRGSLPDDTKTVEFPISDDYSQEDLHDDSIDEDIPHVEIYETKRVCVMTGKRLAGTPIEPQPVDDDVIGNLADEHGRVATSVDDFELEYTQDELEDVETVGDIKALSDAIRQLGPRDFRLKSDGNGKRADGTINFDPSWTNSDSGERLAYDPNTKVGWIYRQGGYGLDALQVVALEERIITSPGDYPQGDDWWNAVEELRNRGAHIPELDTSQGDYVDTSGDGTDVNAAASETRADGDGRDSDEAQAVAGGETDAQDDAAESPAAVENPSYELLGGEIVLEVEPTSGNEADMNIYQNGQPAYSETVDKGMWSNRYNRKRFAGAVAETLTGVSEGELESEVEEKLNALRLEEKNNDDFQNKLRSPELRQLVRRTRSVKAYSTGEDTEWRVALEPPQDEQDMKPKTITLDSGQIQNPNPQPFKKMHVSAFFGRIDIDGASWKELADYWMDIADRVQEDNGDQEAQIAVESFLNDLSTGSWLFFDANDKDALDNGYKYGNRHALYDDNFDAETGQEEAVLVPGQKVRDFLDDVDGMALNNFSPELQERGLMHEPAGSGKGTVRTMINGQRITFWPIDAEAVGVDEDQLHEPADNGGPDEVIDEL